jgi:methylated-DNA-[protein]-cysteine S-methyltransferase
VDEEGRLVELGFRESARSRRRLRARGAGQLAGLDQLFEYFSGKRRRSSSSSPRAARSSSSPCGTRCWRIPYGDTISYAELARRIGKPSAVRAVGAANGANPIPVIIPCHRVIGSNGTLTGYGGGIERKQWLLALEGRRLF